MLLEQPRYELRFAVGSVPAIVPYSGILVKNPFGRFTTLRAVSAYGSVTLGSSTRLTRRSGKRGRPPMPSQITASAANFPGYLAAGSLVPIAATQQSPDTSMNAVAD